MGSGLYQKFFAWFVLNVALLVLAGLMAFGWILFGNSDGLYSPQFFSGNINAVIRSTSVELQYKPQNQWGAVLRERSADYNLSMVLFALDDGAQPIVESALPPRLLATALSLPRPPYTLCADPQSGAAESITPSVEMEAGLLPPQYALFLRDGDPARYWYARTLLVSDENANIRYVLLATASPSITGNGLYFDMYLALAAILVTLGISFLWWWPFVHHVSCPLRLLTRMAERMAGGDYSSLSGAHGQQLDHLISSRHDEVGRLAAATQSMAKKVQMQVYGQRRFIRHIAHELGSPIARIQLGLAVLDDRLKGDSKARVQDINAEVQQLSELVSDVLTFLRSEAIPVQPQRKVINLQKVLLDAVQQEARGVRMNMAATNPVPWPFVWGDEACLHKALNNILRNAVRYAGRDQAVHIQVEQQKNTVILEIQDNGPGVQETELKHLLEPFYRGASASQHPGGSGLGLAIVKHSIEACGGSVSCHNALPKGFTVRIALPCATEQR